MPRIEVKPIAVCHLNGDQCIYSTGIRKYGPERAGRDRRCAEALRRCVARSRQPQRAT